MTEGVERVVRDSVNEALEEANDLLDKAAEASEEEAKLLRSRAKELIAKAKTNFGAYYDKAADEGKVMACQVNDCVHENPWRAVGIAAVAGILLGALVCRK